MDKVSLAKLALKSFQNPKTGTRASAIIRNNYAAKIVLFGEKNSQAQKLGMTRWITELLPNGQKNVVVDFDVKPSLDGGFGRMFNIQGSPQQIKKTLQFLNRTVDKNCNTVTAMNNLEMLRPICGDTFAYAMK